MKKLLLILFSVVFLFSCSESAKDIDVNKIENVEDFLDAMEILADETLELTQKYDREATLSDMSSSDMNEMSDLMKKYHELIEKAKEKGWNENILKHHVKFDEVDAKMDKAYGVYWL
jgi:hypothetical protein